jgi:hypothetical protein
VSFGNVVRDEGFEGMQCKNSGSLRWRREVMRTLFSGDGISD